MEERISWIDWLDNDRVKETGEFYVHRNYLIDNPVQKGQFVYKYIPRRSPSGSFSEKSLDSIEPEYIDQTLPVAMGITGFFVCDLHNRSCLKSYLKSETDFVAVAFYSEYFGYRVKEEFKRNDKQPNPDTENNVMKRFIPLHLKDEQVKLIESMKYFEESNNERDIETNRRLRGYVNGYFNWLTSSVKYDSNIKLFDVCKGEKEYMALIAWLVDQGLIDSDTLKWKDRKSGHKKDIAIYIKTFHIKNYTDYLDDNVIQSIAINTFGVEIKSSTTNHAKPDPDLKIPAFKDK